MPLHSIQGSPPKLSVGVASPKGKSITSPKRSAILSPKKGSVFWSSTRAVPLSPLVNKAATITSPKRHGIVSPKQDGVVSPVCANIVSPRQAKQANKGPPTSPKEDGILSPCGNIVSPRQERQADKRSPISPVSPIANHVILSPCGGNIASPPPERQADKGPPISPKDGILSPCCGNIVSPVQATQKDKSLPISPTSPYGGNILSPKSAPFSPISLHEGSILSPANKSVISPKKGIISSPPPENGYLMKQWMQDKNIFQKDLFDYLLYHEYDGPDDLIILAQNKIDYILRQVRISTLLNIDDLLIEFELQLNKYKQESLRPKIFTFIQQDKPDEQHE